MAPAVSRASVIDADAFSLVLGAGGRPGLAYLAGTLLALDLHGLRASEAESITGTSAGSIATAFLATGGTVEDLAAYTTGSSPRAAFEEMAAAIAAADARRAPLSLGELRRMMDGRGLRSALAHARAGRTLSALVAFAPGLIEIRRRFAFFDGSGDTDGAPTWRIVAADSGGRRHVFHAENVPLSIAVAASCAIPGIFAPVGHQGRRFVDGALHSPTNADLALEDAGRLVVVLAPMCDPDRRERSPASAQARLADEVARLRRAGKRVVVFRPSARLRRVMGRNPLAGRRCRDVTAGAFLEAADLLAEIGPRRAHRVAEPSPLPSVAG